MPKMPRAYIGRGEYESFRRIPTHGLPNTYEEWDREQYKLAAGGNGIIEIHPEEFSHFCRENGVSADTAALNNFAVIKYDHENKSKTVGGQGFWNDDTSSIILVSDE